MTRVAIVGANGQVGAEVCLLLRNHPGLELVPICRNVGGSAFIRSQGVACRHGAIADVKQAAGLVGDCDVVVNAALATGTPGEIKQTERRIIRNSLTHSKRGGRFIHFSTQMVHGDPREAARVHWRSSYGRAKLRSETFVRQAAAVAGNEYYNLRLGHVCGALQNITALIRGRIGAGPVPLPERDRISNTVYTATIVDAILKIIAGRERPGTYDLMNQPQWTWRQVYEYEAGASGQTLDVQSVPEGGPRPGLKTRILGTARRMVRSVGSTEAGKELALRLMAHLPGGHNERMQATWYRVRAAAEIRALRPPPAVDESYYWRPLARVFLQGLDDTLELLKRPGFQINPALAGRPWPADIPLFAGCVASIRV